MDIQWLSLKSVKPYEKNPRKNDKAVAPVVASIKEFGFKQPIVIDADNVIIVGHTRYRAAKELGLDKVPCLIASDLSPEQVKAYRLADNKTAEFATWDFDFMKLELDSIENINMELFGFDLAIDTEPYDDKFDVAEAIPEIPNAQRGDVWILGDHRCVCGDATNKEDVALLMDGKMADLIVTDPPYNVDYEGKTKSQLKIVNDKQSSEDFLSFLSASFANMFQSARDGASAYVFHADTEGANFRSSFCAAGFKLAQVCVWIKNSLVMGRQDYHWQHEPVLYGWNPKGKHQWYSDRKQKTTWEFDRPSRNAEHPTMKPIPLLAYPIKNSSREGDIVLDLFGGSGSTLIACEQTKRICYTMEIDPQYVDVIVKRWEALTGRTAVCEHGGDTLGKETGTSNDRNQLEYI